MSCHSGSKKIFKAHFSVPSRHLSRVIEFEFLSHDLRWWKWCDKMSRYSRSLEVHSQVIKNPTCNFASMNIIKVKAVKHIECSRFGMKFVGEKVWLIHRCSRYLFSFLSSTCTCTSKNAVTTVYGDLDTDTETCQLRTQTLNKPLISVEPLVTMLHQSPWCYLWCLPNFDLAVIQNKWNKIYIPN